MRGKTIPRKQRDPRRDHSQHPDDTHRTSSSTSEYTPRLGRPVLFAHDLLLRPRARQNIRHRVIPLVTFVWKDPFASLAHGNFSAPRSGKRSGIVDGELVSDRIGTGAREPLGQMEVLVGPEEVVGPDEIGGIDDQRVALPMATR